MPPSVFERDGARWAEIGGFLYRVVQLGAGSLVQDVQVAVVAHDEHFWCHLCARPGRGAYIEIDCDFHDTSRARR